MSASHLLCQKSAFANLQLFYFFVTQCVSFNPASGQAKVPKNQALNLMQSNNHAMYSLYSLPNQNEPEVCSCVCFDPYSGKSVILLTERWVSNKLKNVCICFFLTFVSFLIAWSVFHSGVQQQVKAYLEAAETDLYVSVLIYKRLSAQACG